MAGVALLLALGAGEGRASSWTLTREATILELGLSRAIQGQSWAEDFDAGWRRSSGVEAGVESGARLARGPWEVRARWRGRWGEHLDARGRWLEASLRFQTDHFGLRLGREPIDWGPAPRAALLISRNPPPLDHVGAVGDVGLGRMGRLAGEMLVAYLDDRDRTVPFPLLWGMRLAWTPRAWLRCEVQRTILLGGGGRTQRLRGADLWNIFLGRSENAVGVPGHPEAYPVGDSDQKFAWLIDVNPRAWARRYGLHDLEAFWVYAGEDAFHGLGPRAPGRALGLRVHPRPRWAGSFIYASTVDDRNFWYHHKLYGYGYRYRGYVIGHPMGGDAHFWHAALHGMPTEDLQWALSIGRERRGYFRDGRGVVAGGHWIWTLAVEVPLDALQLQVETGASTAWGGDRVAGRLPEGFFGLRLLWNGWRSGSALEREDVWGSPGG